MELNPALLPLETLAWTAISAWALVEWCRPLLNVLHIEGPRRALALRSIALVVGALVGALIHPEVTEDSSSALYGAVIGLGAGAMNSIIVSIIKKKAGLENEPTLALPLIAWSIQLSAEIARSQAQRSHFERRITTLEAQALTRGETLTEIRGLLKELTTQAKYMARDLEELRKGRE